MLGGSVIYETFLRCGAGNKFKDRLMSASAPLQCVCGLCLFVLFLIFCFEGKIILAPYFKEIIIAPYYKEICVHVQMKSQNGKYFPYTKSPRWQTYLN